MWDFRVVPCSPARPLQLSCGAMALKGVGGWGGEVGGTEVLV